VKVATPDELGKFVVDCVWGRRWIITRDLDDIVALPYRRADSMGHFEVLPHHDFGL